MISYRRIKIEFEILDLLNVIYNLIAGNLLTLEAVQFKRSTVNNPFQNWT